MRAEMELGESQKSSPETLNSLGNDLKLENLDFHETIENFMKINDFRSPEDQFGVQICVEEALKLRKK